MKKWILGIDEAGRGCVLGSMVYGGFGCPQDFDFMRKFYSYEIDDSKNLKKESREKTFLKIKSLKEKNQIDFDIQKVTPEEISEKML